MPTEVIIQSNKYLNQYKNGTTYASSTTDLTYNLAGVVMEKLQYSATFDVRWYFFASDSNKVIWEDLGANLFRFKKQAGSLIDDGFSVGDNLDWIYPVSSTIYTENGDVTVITPTWMYVQFSVAPGGLTTTTNTAGVTQLIGLSSLTAFIYSFGLIENSENFNTNSKVTGNNQSFYVGSLVTNVAKTMTPQGTYRDWLTGTVTVTKKTNPSTYVQRFEVVHDFIINPYYIDGQLSNLQNVVTPQLLAGANSLKHVVKAEFRRALSDPNSAKINNLDYILGSVGYFEENMNGFNNIYSIGTVNYTNASLTSADGLLTSEQTIVTFTISKATGNFVATDKVGLFISYLPTQSEYTDTTTSFESNFIYDNIFALADGITVIGANAIDSLTCVLNAGDIDVTLKVTYSTAQQILIAQNNNPNYLIGCLVGDVSLTNANSDRVMLIADANAYDTSADIAGLFTVNNIEYFTHDMDYTTDTGYTSLDQWNEDGFIMKFDFDLDLNKSALLNTLAIDLVSVDATTFDSFNLDTYQIPIGNIISGGVQQINVSTDRGYILQNNSGFNIVSVTTGSQVGGLQNYTVIIGQKLTWQDWIQNLDVFPEFYDNTKLNDNLNYKTSNYANLINNNVIKLAIKANVYGVDSTTGISGNTDYNVVTSGNITVYDYDKDANSPSERFSGVIETFTEDGLTNLGGALLTNGDNTLVKTTWTDNVYGNFVSIWNYYGIHRIEPSNAQGVVIEELSSINTPATGQLAIPISGSTLLDMTIVGGKLITKSLVDGSVQNTSIDYKLSSRIQSPNNKTELDIINFYHQNEVTTKPLTTTITKTGATSQ